MQYPGPAYPEGGRGGGAGGGPGRAGGPVGPGLDGQRQLGTHPVRHTLIALLVHVTFFLPLPPCLVRPSKQKRMNK